MAVLEITRSHNALNGFGKLFTKPITAYTEWNNKRATRAALSKLSNRELEDIGLSRGDIDAI